MPHTRLWCDVGLCRLVPDASVFYAGTAAAAAAAKSVCAQCPFLFECQDAPPPRHGVVGGLDELERTAIERRRGIFRVLAPLSRA